MKPMLWGMVAVILLGMLIGNAQAADRQIIRRIYFAIDQADLLPASRPVLHEMADLLRANPRQNLRLAGHTCDLESHGYNQVLARRRAEHTLAYLMSAEGIARNRVSITSFGEEQPRCANSDEQSRAMNRRVVLTLDILAADAPVKTAAPAANIMTVTSAARNIQSAAILLLDSSNSINLNDMRDAVRQFRGPTRLTGQQQNTGLSRESGTRLYNAITKVSAGHLASHPGPRYLIIFSDGIAEIPRFSGGLARANTLDQAVAAANENAVKLITVEIGPTTAAGRQALQDLAGRTGGQAVVWNYAGGSAQFADIYRLTGNGTRTSDYRTGEYSPEVVVVNRSIGWTWNTR